MRNILFTYQLKTNQKEINVRQQFSFIRELIILSVSGMLFFSISLATIAQEDLDGITIVYFTQADTKTDLLSSQLTATTSNIETFQSWNDVVERETQTGIDALVIDNEALALVDHDWLSEAYNRGIVISGINVEGKQLSDALGTRCSIMTDQLGVQHYVVMAKAVAGENPEEVLRVEQAIESTCGRNTVVEGIEGVVIYTMGSSSSNLISEKDYEEFIQTLEAHVQNARSTYDLYIEQIAGKSE